MWGVAPIWGVSWQRRWAEWCPHAVLHYDPWLDTLSILDPAAQAHLASSAVNIGGYSWVVGGNGAPEGGPSVLAYHTLGEPSMPVPEVASLWLVAAGIVLLTARRAE